VAAITLFGVTIISTIGFILTGRYEGTLNHQIIEGLWDTLNLVSTVGNLDELTTGQKIWGMIVITIGLGAVLYGFSIMQGLIHGKDMYRQWEQRKMKQTLESMQNHIVICGYGHVGRRTAEELTKSKLGVVVIERNPQTAEEASDDGFLVVESDATDGDTPLQHAQISKALGLIAAMPEDSSNVYVCMVAKELNNNLRIIARGEHESSRQWLERAGANDVVVPGESAANLLASLLTSPHLHEFFSQIACRGEHTMIEIALDTHPEAEGKTLAELDIHKNHTGVVMSVRTSNGEHQFNPPSDRTLAIEDSLLILVPSDFDCSTSLM
jgi:voltage-gated potassium channel